MTHLKNKKKGGVGKSLREQVQQEYREKFGLKKRYEWLFVPEAYLGPPEIFHDEITPTVLLGEDNMGFSQVFSGNCRDELVCIKIINISNITGNRGTSRIKETQVQSFREQINYIASIFHPNLCLFLGATTTNNQLMIISELINTNLYTFSTEKGISISLSKRMQMAKDAALGINWLHEASPPISHGSLTPNNLLVDKNLHVKVSDIGMSNIKRIFGVTPLSHPQKNLETLIWLPPEILEGKRPTEKGDVYSFGLVLWMLITFEKPFSECSTFEKLKETIVKNKQRPQIPHSCPTTLKGLITSCWADDPSSRPSFKQVITQLDSLIVETAIPHPEAATFWKNYFSDLISVEWSVFINALVTEIKQYNNPPSIDNLNKTSSPELDQQKINCLQVLAATKGLTSSGKELVHIERFGWIVSWFGPINKDFLEKIRSVIYSTWFHGDIIARSSETLLQQKNPGTFLVRLSTFSFGSYVLSYVTQSCTINHQRFSYDLSNNVFVLSDKQYPTLSALLNANITSFHLSVPCLGSKFTTLYTEVECKGYIGMQ